MTETGGELTLGIEGMTCTGCSSSLERALRAAPGVKEAHVTFEAGEAVVRFDPAETNAQKLLEVVDRAGFDGSLRS